MKKLGVCVLLVGLIAVSGLLVYGTIGVPTATFLAVIWLGASLVFILGPETITEITVWKASIKRDVQAAKEFRDQAQKISADLQNIAKLVVENSYILASTSGLAMGGEVPARERLEGNLSQMSSFAVPDEDEQARWWEEVTSVFASRGARNTTTNQSRSATPD